MEEDENEIKLADILATDLSAKGTVTIDVETNDDGKMSTAFGITEEQYDDICKRAHHALMTTEKYGNALKKLGESVDNVPQAVLASFIMGRTVGEMTAEVNAKADMLEMLMSMGGKTPEEVPTDVTPLGGEVGEA